MPLREADNFSSIDISRPVTGPGVVKLLNVARHTGNIIFGTDESSVYTGLGETDTDAQINGFDTPNDETGEYPEILKIEGIGTPRLQVYNEDDLRLTLLHRRLPLDLNGTSQLRTAGRKLTRVDEDGSKSKDRTTALQDILARIGYQYDVPRQDEVPIKFTGYTINPDPDFANKGMELALVPSPADMVTHMNVAHMYECYRGLGRISRKAVYPNDGAKPLNVPFLRLPKDSLPEELERFMKVLDDQLPIRGVMGEIPRQPTVVN
ncbi:MAG: hypothetical protein ABIQ89_04210 [Candidatus Saccharimonadales bacterium]